MNSNRTVEKMLIVFSIVLIAYTATHGSRAPKELPQVIGSGAIEKEIQNQSASPLKIPKLSKDDLIYSTKRNTVPMVNEEFKVIFFQVAKAASSEWIRFFARLAGNPLWCGSSIHDNKNNKVKRLSDFTLEQAQKMMIDPTWTKAIFVRNPKTRLLSAFLDKAVAHTHVFATKYCKSYEGNGGDFETCVKFHEHFDFFLHNVTTYSWENVHWRPIYTRIDEKWWPYMNYIANMENLSYDAAHFLQSIHSVKDGVSAWDRIGESGWSDNERDCNTMGNRAFLEKKDTKHQTNAEDKLRSYFTPELENFVERQYSKDFNNPYFRFSTLKLYPEDQEFTTGKLV